MLADYLKRQAMQDLEKGAAAPVALVHPDGTTIIGYYTLSAAQVDLDRIPPAVGRKLPKYPVIGAVRLGRLAVDDRFLGQRFGEELLMNALDRAESSTRIVASAFIIVDAKDADAIRFYAKYGFHQFADNASQLFITMSEVRRALGRS